MTNASIEGIIIKFVTRHANKEELDLIREWLETPENMKEFKQYSRLIYAINYSLSEMDGENLKKNLLDRIQKDKRSMRKRKLMTVLGMAVSIVLISLAGYWMMQNVNQEEISDSTDHLNVLMDQESIIFRSAEGHSYSLDGKTDTVIHNNTGQVIGTITGKTLQLKQLGANNVLALNKIEVPRGQRFEVNLADGTQIVLNSDSKLEFPNSFEQLKIREVYLSSGEAFFNVTTDKSKPFVLKAQDLDVAVLGTSFNVSSYPEDRGTEVVLVEGSVDMQSSLKPISIRLSPGFKGEYNRETQTLTQDKANTDHYTQWVNGKIVFRKLSFDRIINKLERIYNVTIINNNEALDKETFNLTIDYEEDSISDVLGYFEKIFNIQYQVVDYKVIIN